MRHVALLVLGAFIAGNPAEAATNFDLDCSLHETLTLPNKPNETKDYSRRISIDLLTSHWCYQDLGCKRIEKIAQISDDEIRLVDINSSFMTSIKSINRSTWAWSNHTELKIPFLSTTEETGSCALMPFTPIPSGKAHA